MNTEQLNQVFTTVSAVIETLGGRPLNDRTQRVWESALKPFDFNAVLNSLKKWSLSESVPPKPADIVRQLSPSTQSANGNKSFVHGKKQPLLREKREFIPNELDRKFEKRISILFDYLNKHPCPENYNLRQVLGGFIREPETLKMAHLEYLLANKAITVNNELTGNIDPAFSSWEEACGSIELEKALGVHEHLLNVSKQAPNHDFYWDFDGHVLHFFPEDFPLNNIKHQFDGFDPLAEKPQRSILSGLLRSTKSQSSNSENKNFGHWQSAF